MGNFVKYMVVSLWMSKFVKIVLNRNFILILAVVTGLLLGEVTRYLKEYIIYLLALVMIFSTTAISTRAFLPIKKTIRPFLYGIFLNYLVFGIFMLLSSFIFIKEEIIFHGFVIIVATPPGVAIIPFTFIFRGDTEYGIIGVLGAFFASIFMAPLLVMVFTGNNMVNPLDIFLLMGKVIVLPFLFSRVLLHEKLKPGVERIRGSVVDWGFAFIIFIVVGLNRDILFGNPGLIAKVSIVLFISIFVLGTIYEFIAKYFNRDKTKIIPEILLVTIKSSGFSAVTAIALFNERAAIPSALLAIFVLIYLLFLSFRSELKIL